jgi:hypothetical protein
MSTLTRGDKLPSNLQREVLASYIYRLTTENGYPQRNPCGARVPAISDKQWMAEHAFYVTARGTLDASQHHAEPAFMISEVAP